jgi:hypothetical protein
MLRATLSSIIKVDTIQRSDDGTIKNAVRFDGFSG